VKLEPTGVYVRTDISMRDYNRTSVFN